MAKRYEDDDGRTVVSMDVEGMPWHDDRKPKTRKRMPDEGSDLKIADDLTKEEERAIFWGSFKASLLVALIFAAAGVLAVAFCVFVWFR